MEDIRALIDQVRIPPQIGKYSVYIIDEVHMLSAGAFNALLKTLEEPPKHAIFILATTEKHKVLATILSRCQVYDFSRITILDTIRHLQYVAKQEGITATDEVLNVVAQKADGGMRDALSIFDQLVSFCGKDITYKQAIEVLNVLDSDYYFRIVDAALSTKVSEALLLFNEILQKGFDGGNFITGFAQHLRDVLVSKDAATLPLLETSDTIRLHYQEQAKMCSAKWLFNALDITNTCDINYRTSKNKRLIVELALIKLCRLAEPNSSTPTTPSTPNTTSNHSTPNTTKPSTTPTVTSAPNITKPSTATTVSRPSTTPTPTPPLGNMPSLGNIGLIAPNQIQSSATQSTSTPTQPIKNTSTPPSAQRNTPFTPDQLIGAWVGLNKHFSKEERLLAILSACRPILLNPELCQITVANPWQKQEFSKFGKQVMQIIRDTLQNDLIKLQIAITEVTTNDRAYSTADKYKRLAELNPHIVDLKTQLNLQLE